jgi:excisionase family DNA binding protein
LTGQGLFSVKEAASYLGISPCTVYRLEKKGGLPSIRGRGLRIRFKKEDIDIWLEKRKARPLPCLHPSSLTTPPASPIKRGYDEKGGAGEMALAKSRTRLNFGYGAIYQRKTKDGKARWYLDFRDATGRRVQRVAKDAISPQEAAQALQEAIRQDLLEAGKLDVKPERVLFEDFADIFYHSYVLANWKRPAFEKGRLRIIVDFFRGHELRDVTPMMIERFRQQRLKSGKARSTINRDLALMKKMYNVAINEGLVTDNPVRKVKFYSEADNVKEQILSPEEEERLLAAAPGHLRSILIIALNTGMRWGEIVGLEWKRVDLRAQLIHVVKAKSGKPRFININDPLMQELTRLKAGANGSPHVLPNEGTGKPYACLYRCFAKACKAAGITGLRFHDLRHTFATRLIQGGVDIETVRSLLGHHSIIMTQRYTHSSHETKQRAVDILALPRVVSGPKNGGFCDTAVTRRPETASPGKPENLATASESVN